MDPWEIGTGFMVPPTAAVGGGMPVAPSMDLPSMLAGHLAAQGIRPQQWLQNPGLFHGAPSAPFTGNEADADVWDPTPVATPGGPAIGANPVAPPPLNPGAVATPAISAPADTGLSGLEASATGTTAEKKGEPAKPGDSFLAALKGVQAPKPPAVQTIRSPAAPEPAKQAIKSGQLLALLTALQPQLGAQRQNPLAGMSLGALLGGRG